MEIADFKLKALSIAGNGNISVHWITEDGTSGRTRSLPAHKDLNAQIKKVEGILASYYDLNEDRVTMKKVNVVHYDDGMGESVQITGTFCHSQSNQNTPIKTSKIQAHNDMYGFESELKTILKKLSDECYKYVYEDKSSQVSMKLDKTA